MYIWNMAYTHKVKLGRVVQGLLLQLFHIMFVQFKNETLDSLQDITTMTLIACIAVTSVKYKRHAIGDSPLFEER